MHVIWEYNFFVNQVLAKLLIVAMSIGVMLWSWAVLRVDRMWRVVGLSLWTGAVGAVLLRSSSSR